MGSKIALAVMLFLTACASMPAEKDVPAAPIANPKTVWCDTNMPERYTPDERAALSIERKREDLAFNLQGADWCGWKP